jgi:hypothetical protein
VPDNLVTGICVKCGSSFQYFSYAKDIPDTCYTCQRKEGRHREKVKKAVKPEPPVEELALEPEVIEEVTHKKIVTVGGVDIDLLQKSTIIPGVSLRLSAKYGNIRKIVKKGMDDHEQRSHKST